MFLTEGIYDIDELARFNLHIHTCFSNCANEEMTFKNIVKTAEKAGLEMIALCDHVYKPEELDGFNLNCKTLKQKRDRIESKVKILIGGEFSSYGAEEYTLKNIEIKTDYRLYAQNHFHVTGWEQVDNKTPESYKELTKRMLETLFKDRAADTVAHPLCGMYLKKITDWETDTLGKCWKDEEIAEIMPKAYESECAWEINTVTSFNDPQLARRMYHIGKELGIVFTLGTDAHLLKNIDTKNFTEELKRILY